MSSLDDVQEKLKDEFIRGIFGFRVIHVMHELVEVGNNNKLLLQELYELFLSRGCVCTVEDIVYLIDKSKNLIKYAFYDATEIWLNGVPIEFTHDMPQDVLEYYRDSMEELHELSNITLPTIAYEYINNKAVLDFGCGNGYFSKHLAKQSALYIGVDREEILFSPDEPRIPDPFIMTEDELEKKFKSRYFDVLWLSEVVHSKSSPAEFVTVLMNKYCKNNAVCIIVGLKPSTPRSELFNAQLRLHGAKPNRDIHRNHDFISHFTVLGMFDISRYQSATVIQLIK